MKQQRHIKFIFLAFTLFVCQMLSGQVLASDAAISALKKEIAALDKSIVSRKQQLSAESEDAIQEAETARETLRATKKKLLRGERKIKRDEERLSLVNENLRELNTWYGALSGIEKGLNSSTYEAKKDAYGADRDGVLKTLKALTREQTKNEVEVLSLQAKVDQFDKQSSSSASYAADAKLKTLNKQKSAKLKALTKLSKAKTSGGGGSKVKKSNYAAYVYVISGKQSGKIESSLRLKKWVESYQAKYIQSNWNDLTGKDSASSGSMIKFLTQMESELKSIPSNANLILIGYGLGGGAALLTATEVANKLNRRVDYLVTLDPIGQGGSRLNIVYQTSSDCNGRIPPAKYLECMQKSRKRVITKNVKNFYNRWQRESSSPYDAKDYMKVGKEYQPLSTGKFVLANSSVKSNQKRMFYGSEKQAREYVLSDAASELPKMLVQYLR